MYSEKAISKTIDGVKNANVKKGLEQEIQKYFDLHEDLVDLQLDTFLSKTSVLREMVQFLIDHKTAQLYKDKLDNWTDEYISFYGNRKIAKHYNGLGRYISRGYDTYGLFKLVGGLQKGNPTEGEIKRAVDFYKNLL